jgi:two-component system NarL family response regulator
MHPAAVSSPESDHMTLHIAATPLPATAAKPLIRGVPRTVFRVFVVEGQTAERTVLGQIIRRDSSLVADGEATTTHDALAMLSAEDSQPDIICVSWLLDGGGIDRWAFVDELRLRCPDARLVMTCPKERPAILRTAHEHGIEVLHSTRDSFHSLRRALHHAAQSQPYVSPRLQEAAKRGEALAPRLQEILTHMSEGASRPEIGRRLGISESTVRSHSKAIFERLGVNERAHAVAIGVRTGLIK